MLLLLISLALDSSQKAHTTHDTNRKTDATLRRSDEFAEFAEVAVERSSSVCVTMRRMNRLSAFPITQKWPAQHPDRIQLYSLATPSGVKASIMLEETGLPYEAHLVSFDTHDQTSPEFLSLSPNNKIPAIFDPNGPGGKPLGLFESGAILIYLAEKTGRFMPLAATRPFSG